MRKLLFVLMLFTAPVAQAQNAGGAVWRTQHDWLQRWNPRDPSDTRTWEDKYSEWIHDSVDEKIFTQSQTALRGIPTDCATANYALRAYFASQNGLPFVASKAGGGTISNDSSARGTTQQDRVHNFIIQVLNNVSTDTLSKDSYPISIDRDYVKPGSLVLMFNPAANHSSVIKDVSNDGIIKMLASTTPRQTRELNFRTGFVGRPLGDRDGIRSWKHYYKDRSGRWVERSDEPGSRASLGSNYVDQLALATDGSTNWEDAVKDALGENPEDPLDQLDRLVRNACDAVHQREGNDADIANYLRTSGGACMNAQKFEDLSTPNLDRTIWLKFQIIDQWILKMAKTASTKQYLIGQRDEKFQGCTVNTPAGEQDLRWIRKKFKHHLFSSDPNDSYEWRWGVDANDPRDSRAGKTVGDDEDMIWPKDYSARDIAYTDCINGARHAGGYSSYPQPAPAYSTPASRPVIQQPVINGSKPAESRHF